MTHTPHQLAEEFPKHVARMRELKQANAHFARLLDMYCEVDGAIHRAETNTQPMDDFHMEKLRRQRLRLKFEIYGMLTA